jgi:hypothetical protein
LIVLRLIGILVLITIGASIAMYLITRNRRYIDFARRVFQLAVVFIIVFMVLYVVERLVLVV